MQNESQDDLGRKGRLDMFDDFGTDGHVEPTSQVQRQTQVVLDDLGGGYMIPVECRRHTRSGALDGDESSTTVHVEKSFGKVPTSVAEFDEACDVTWLLPMLFVQQEETTELIDQRRVYSHMI